MKKSSRTTRSEHIYGVWCRDVNDWLREERFDVQGIIVFLSRRLAMMRAAEEYGFATYSAAKRADWCEVRPIGSRVKGK